MFQVRIHCIDYCLAAPTRIDFDGSLAPITRNDNKNKTVTTAANNNNNNNSNNTNQQGDSGVRVPVIRVFGATASGEIACAHIHGVFPYLFVPFDGFPFSEVDRAVASLRHGINQALGRAAVLAVTPVRGIPFYGFHVGFRLFLKIYLLDPSVTTRVAEMLRQGRIAGIPQLMPHESHIPFLLQFMTDYNLYGCDLLTASDACVRNSGDRDRASCPVEVDILPQHIRNRDAVPERRQHVSFPETPTPSNQRLVYSLAALWREMAAKYDKGGKKSEEDRRAWEAISTQDAFAQLGASSSDPRRTPSPWLREEEYREQIAGIIRAESQAESQAGNTAKNTARRPRDPLEDCVPTTRQSVEDFYPRDERTDNRKRKRPSDARPESSHGAGHIPAACEPEEQDNEQEEDGAGAGQLSGLNSLRKFAVPATTDVARKSLSAGRDRQLSQTCGTSASGSSKASRRETGTPSRSQPLEIRPSQERRAKKRQWPPAETHRPLSQSFSVVKSAFPQEEKRSKNDVSGGMASRGEENKGRSRNSHGCKVPSIADCHEDGESSVLQPNCRSRRDFRLHGDSEVKRMPGEVRPPQSRQAQKQGPFYRASRNVLAIYAPAPDREAVVASLGAAGPDQIHQDAHFSNAEDAARAGPAKERRAAIASVVRGFDFLRRFPAPHGHRGTSTTKRHAAARSWHIAHPPPTYAAVESWLASDDVSLGTRREARASEAASIHRRMTAARLPKEKRAAAVSWRPAPEVGMQTLCLEAHANSRGAFLPNPERDPVVCVAWKSTGKPANAGRANESAGASCGGVICAGRSLHDEFAVEVVADERELLLRVVQIVQDLDPDILAGYEITTSSWGYLAERAATYEVDLWQDLSRVRQPRVVPYHERGQSVTGRLMLSVDQIMRSDLDLRQYTLESAAWSVLGQRVPLYAAHVLTSWASSGRQRDLSRLLRHCRRRAALGLALLEATELVAKTAEQARVLGVDFASVLDRGSQFKVESVMLRVAKPEGFVMPSPNHEQVGQQNAAECMPLVLEPRSAFYSSPVVVLDFTSLYPSLMIAYNLCYSTFLGRLDPLYSRTETAAARQTPGERTAPRADPRTEHPPGSGDDVAAAAIARHRQVLARKMGFATYNRPAGLLEQLSRLGIVVAPTGMMYVGAQTRQSLLAKMLAEILDTRVMVKAALKRTAKANLAERQRLNSRQLALKLLANVTYGYTSASFSGRMPCVEVADSIVQTGRETLNRAIALIHSVRRWNAEVVYGDTDSLFVHLPGRTRAQAFQIGAEMAEAVTASNPHPVRLKFEKVYHPCVLLAKKRYVGYEFDTVDQDEPIFDAKGIETVRRDGTPAASKVLEQCLRILFDSADLSQVKDYVLARFDDIANSRLPLADLCFAKEVRQPGSYRAPPPGAMVAARRMARDPRAVLLHGERVPYVVLAGPPGTPLRDRCVSPEELVRNRHLRIDSDYYIRSSLIPPLDRIFRLVGVDIEQWYLDMPRIRMPLRTTDPAPTQTQRIGQMTLDVWLRGARCARCDTPVRRRRRRQLQPRTSTMAASAVGRGAATCHDSDGDAEDAEDAEDADDEEDECAAGSDPGNKGAAMDNDSDESFDSTAKLKSRPVLCKDCGRDNLGTLFYLQSRARDAEKAYRSILHGCRSCAGLGEHDELRCENMTCPVYFVRTERFVQAKVERSKTILVQTLARRGMQDLEW